MPNSAQELIEENASFFNERPIEADTWKKVRGQSARHMLRQDVTDLFDITRPNESQEIRDFRDNVRRRITVEGVTKFLSKVSSIFIENGLRIDPESLSDALLQWTYYAYIAENKSFDLEEFTHRVLLPYSTRDPNALLAAMPINPENETMPPSLPLEMGGLSPLRRVWVDSKIISSADIVYFSRDVVAWNGGKYIYDAEKKLSASYYWIADDTSFWRYLPRKKRGGGVEYDLELWYVHGVGEVPVQTLGGYFTELSMQPHQPNVLLFYFESFLQTYFELSDEALMAFSDNQAVRIQHAYPKAEIKPMPCTAKGCKNGKVRIFDPESGKPTDVEDCTACNGTGYITNPGPYNFLVRHDVPGVDNNSPVMTYIVPPVEILKESYEVAFDLLMKAKKSIGLDILENVVESGVAKSMRMDDLRHFLKQIADNLFSLIRNHIGFVDAMLNIDPANRSEPMLDMPPSIQLADKDALKEEAKDPLRSDRYQSTVDYYRKKYKDDQVTLRIQTLALDYSPLLLLMESEISQGIAVGAYTKEDIIRRDNAIQILNDMREELGDMDFMRLTDQEIIAIAESLLEPMLPEEEDFTRIPDFQRIEEPEIIE